MSRRYMIFVLVTAVVLGGAVIVALFQARSVRAVGSSRADTRPQAVEKRVAPAPSCFGQVDTSVSHETVVNSYLAAISLGQQKHYDAALEKLHKLIASDPGFPGAHLAVSQAQMALKHPEEAKAAVGTEIAMSECILKLPSEQVQAYCSTELPRSTLEGCRTQLSHIGRSAHFQSALVDLSLGRNIDAEDGLGAHASMAPPPELRALSQKAPPELVAPQPAIRLAERPRKAAQEPKGISVDSEADTTEPRPEPPSRGPLQAGEAAEHIGEVATVCGEVVSKHTAEETTGKPTFINFDHAYPDQTFTVVIWDRDKEDVGDFPESGRACVRGTVSAYRGVPQIVLRNSRSWSIKKSAAAPQQQGDQH